MKPTVLLTGGTGLIGRYLIAKLSPDYDITVVSRDPARASRLLGDAVKPLTLDSIEHLNDINIVINLAGEPIADRRWSNAQKKRICDSRWDTTDTLVRLINQAHNKPRVFISGSAVGVYGRQSDTPIDESFTDFYDEFSSEVCATWEKKAQEAIDVRTCILRTGIVLAEDGGALAKMLMPFRLGLGGKISSGKQFMPWIHIEDMVAGILHLIKNDNCQGPFNFTSPNPNTNHFFSLALARRLERPLFFTIPAFVLKAAMGESSDLVLFGQKALPKKLEQTGFKFSYPELKDALKALDI